jgi:hypothetical protein
VSGPVTVTFFRRLAHLARARRPGRRAGGRGSGIRRGSQAAITEGAVRGSRRAVGLASKGRGEAAARNGEIPGEPRPPTAVTLAALPSRLLARVLAAHGRGRQARRAEGAPLKPWRWLSQDDSRTWLGLSSA